MIVVLVVSMYLLMKHRMQMQTRYLTRRSDLLGACNFPTDISVPVSANGRRVELFPASNDQGQVVSRSFPLHTIDFGGFDDGGPPPYSQCINNSQNAFVCSKSFLARRARNEILPPLPTYEDATKLPSLRSKNSFSYFGQIIAGPGPNWSRG